MKFASTVILHQFVVQVKDCIEILVNKERKCWFDGNCMKMHYYRAILRTLFNIT